MKTFMFTVIEGAIGLAALYLVGRMAFQAGRETANAEHHYEDVKKQTQALKENKVSQDKIAKEETEEPQVIAETEVIVPEKKQSKFSMLMDIKRIFSGKNKNFIGRLIEKPQDHKIQAFLDSNELHVKVKPRTA